jgi:iron complex outermembrane receptor protein
MTEHKIAAGISILAIATFNAAAYAQIATASADTTSEGSPSADVEEVIVTARKRSETLQSVPISITAVNAAAIERNGITTVDQVGMLTPNVYMAPAGVTPTEFTAYIRGLGNRSGDVSQDNPVAVSIDGVYLPTVVGTLVDIFDVQQIEVLRGPQGTLQGRNSPGGVVSITTQRPSGTFGAKFEASYAKFNETNIKGMVEGPLVDGILAGRISAYSNNGGNFMTNINSGTKTNGGATSWGTRVGLLLTPSDDFKAYLTLYFERNTSPQPAIRTLTHADTIPAPYPDALPEPPSFTCAALGYCRQLGQYQTGAEFTKHNDDQGGGAALNVDWNLGPVTLTSVTGYIDTPKEDTRFDADTTPLVGAEYDARAVAQHALSQELRFASNGHGAFSYVVGAYALRSQYRLLQTIILNGLFAGLPPSTAFAAVRRTSQRTNSNAAFGQVTYQVTDQWSFSGGVRYTADSKDLLNQNPFPGPVSEYRADFNDTSLEAGTEYRLDPDKLVYFRFSQAYRGGGINGGGFGGGVSTYDPEKVNSYEVGLKSEWLDRRLTANFTAFYYDYKDLQVVTLGPAGNLNNIRNVGMKEEGIEVETAFHATENFRLHGSAGWLHAKYDHAIIALTSVPPFVDMADIRKDNAPEFTGYLGFDYHVPIGSTGGLITCSGDANYRSTFATNPVPTAISFQKSYALVNGSISYRTANQKYAVTIFGRNLTNKYYKVIGETGADLSEWDVVGRPRTFGIRVLASY